MTRAEALIWRELRAKRLETFKFKRQAPIGPYIADFVCFDAKIIVELDGEPHENAEQRKKDITRDQWLESEGFRVLRFKNDEALGNPLLVIDTIVAALRSPSLGTRLRRVSALSHKGREREN